MDDYTDNYRKRIFRPLQAAALCLIISSCAWGQAAKIKPQGEAQAAEPPKQPVVSVNIDSPPKPQTAAAQSAAKNPEDLVHQIDALTRKVEALESKLAAMAEKSPEKANEKPLPLESVKHMPSVGITPKTLEHIGAPLTPTMSRSDPEAGFVNDAAVKDYRTAKVLFDAKKYTEAVLAFSNFLEKYPDHALAGSAQFYIGVSYSNQNEPKLALHELERVLTSYDRSVPVAETLRRMAELEDSLKLSADAQKHRQLLNSLFAQSPAASTTASNAPGKSVLNAATTPQGSQGTLDEPPPPTAPLPQNAPQNTTEVKSH